MTDEPLFDFSVLPISKGKLKIRIIVGFDKLIDNKVIYPSFNLFNH